VILKGVKSNDKKYLSILGEYILVKITNLLCYYGKEIL
jgi:hypothetical protein